MSSRSFAIICSVGSTILLLQIGCSAHGRQGQPLQGGPLPPGLALTNAALIDVRTGELHQRFTVLIAGNQITAVGPGSTVRIPAGARIVDANWKYLIPGLTDTHVHLFSEWTDLPIDTSAYFAWILAGGVTSIREMSAGDGSEAIAVRAATNTGRLLAPRIYVSAGPNRRLADPWSELFRRLGTSDVAAVLRQFPTLGIDGLKLSHNAPRDSMLALIALARAANVPVYGHTVRASPDRPPIYDNFTMDLVRAGLDGVVHATGTIRPPGLDTGESPTLPRTTAEGRRAWQLHYFTAWQRASDRDIQMLIDTMVARRVWYEPTRLLDYYWNHQAEYDTAGLSLHHPWRTRAQYTSADTQMSRAVMQSEAAEARFIKRFYDAGGMLLAGTDDVAFPPYGVSGDLCLFVDAGLSPLAALQAATINAARAMRWEDRLGSVEVGKLADIVLLDANPLQDVANVRRIHAVIADGRFLDRTTLDQYLIRVGTPIETTRRASPPTPVCR